MMHLPSPKSDFLQEFVVSLQRRTKAIRYRGGTWQCDRVVIVEDQRETEKLEIECRGRTPNSGPMIRIDVYEDRWIEVDARQASKNGWLWNWQIDGRAFGKEAGAELVAALEETVDTSVLMTSNATDQFDAIWRPLLAIGPVLQR